MKNVLPIQRKNISGGHVSYASSNVLDLVDVRAGVGRVSSYRLDMRKIGASQVPTKPVFSHN